MQSKSDLSAEKLARESMEYKLKLVAMQTKAITDI